MSATVQIVEAGTPEEVTMSVTFPAAKRCPFKDELDEGLATLVWKAHGRTLELHSLREYLDSLESWTVSHEEYTVSLRDLLRQAGMVPVRVHTQWGTAAGTVEVHA